MAKKTISIKKSVIKRNLHQLEFNLIRPLENDRNHELGGRSFYFFDFDDNVAYLSTPIIVFHKTTGEEKHISSNEFAQNSKYIGRLGVYKDYFLSFDDERGSFRNFRDKSFGLLDKIIRKKQIFLQDFAKALSGPELLWKAPSWQYFYYAIYNRRPISIITARGHDKLTIQDGMKLLKAHGHIPYLPNFLNIYPVSNYQTRIELGDKSLQATVPQLKRVAIRKSVEEAIETYGHNPHHRFGMSDDDPSNIEMITEEMKALKQDYPEMSFFVIQTFSDKIEKREILTQQRPIKKRVKTISSGQQLDLFK